MCFTIIVTSIIIIIIIISSIITICCSSAFIHCEVLGRNWLKTGIKAAITRRGDAGTNGRGEILWGRRKIIAKKVFGG